MHLILLAIACLSVQFVAKYVGHNVKKLPYDFVGMGGLFFLLTAASGLELGGPDVVHSLVGIVSMISPILGWFCLLGAMEELGRKPDRSDFIETWAFVSPAVFAYYLP